MQRDQFDKIDGVEFVIAEDEHFRCQCDFGHPCQRRATEEDQLCTWCRGPELVRAPNRDYRQHPVLGIERQLTRHQYHDRMAREFDRRSIYGDPYLGASPSGLYQDDSPAGLQYQYGGYVSPPMDMLGADSPPPVEVAKGYVDMGPSWSPSVGGPVEELRLPSRDEIARQLRRFQDRSD
jgi:hypothetical protein